MTRAWDALALLGLLVVAGCASSRTASLPAPPRPPSGAAASAAARPETNPAGAAREAAAAAEGAAGSQAGEPVSGSEGTVAAGGARTSEERRDVLDKKLGDSLQAFDALLLKEQQDAARERAANAPTGGGSEGGQEGEGGGSAAGAGGRGGEGAGGRGKDAARGGTKSRPGGSEREGARPGASAEPEGEPAGGERRTAGAPGTEASQGAGAVPPDVGDGRDDDVVARQIREAAMKEEDPAIREKLWEEYRRYKASRPGGGA